VPRANSLRGPAWPWSYWSRQVDILRWLGRNDVRSTGVYLTRSVWRMAALPRILEEIVSGVLVVFEFFILCGLHKLYDFCKISFLIFTIFLVPQSQFWDIFALNHGHFRLAVVMDTSCCQKNVFFSCTAGFRCNSLKSATMWNAIKQPLILSSKPTKCTKSVKILFSRKQSNKRRSIPVHKKAKLDVWQLLPPRSTHKIGRSQW
jgi:hypothetical protein